MAMKWFVVHTYSGFEEKVKADLLQQLKQIPEVADLIAEVIVPVEPAAPIGEPKRPGGRRKFFPGYILVNMELTEETQHFIRHRPNVTGFLGNEKGPRPLGQSEVDAIRHQMDAGPVRKVAEVQFEEGSAVRIKEGPFVNFSGMIAEVKPDKRKLRVLVTIFGRATPVELNFNQVERV